MEVESLEDPLVVWLTPNNCHPLLLTSKKRRLEFIVQWTHGSTISLSFEIVVIHYNVECEPLVLPLDVLCKPSQVNSNGSNQILLERNYTLLLQKWQKTKDLLGEAAVLYANTSLCAITDWRKVKRLKFKLVLSVTSPTDSLSYYLNDWIYYTSVLPSDAPRKCISRKSSTEKKKFITLRADDFQPPLYCEFAIEPQYCRFLKTVKESLPMITFEFLLFYTKNEKQMLIATCNQWAIYLTYHFAEENTEDATLILLEKSIDRPAKRRRTQK